MMLFTILFVSVLLNGCEDDILKSDSKFECTINGEAYLEHPSMFITPGALHSPRIEYRDSVISFYSSVHPIDTSSNLPFYVLRFKIHFVPPLIEGKRYQVSPLPNLEYLIDMDRTWDYYEQKKSFCSLGLNASMYLCFGTGYIEFTKIDFENKEMKGQIEFEVVSPDEEDNKKSLKVQGEFYITGESNLTIE